MGGEGGFGFCPAPISQRGGSEEEKKKQVASSKEQCGIEWRSADRANPSAAGMSCAPPPASPPLRLHEWARLCEIPRDFPPNTLTN